MINVTHEHPHYRLKGKRYRITQKKVKKNAFFSVVFTKTKCEHQNSNISNSVLLFFAAASNFSHISLTPLEKKVKKEEKERKQKKVIELKKKYKFKRLML